MNKMLKFNFIMLYICFFIMLLNNNFLMKWIIYEFSMILMIFILNSLKNSTKMISILYFTISSISSIMFLFFMIMNNYFTLSLINSKFLMNFFLLNMFLKLSMFPFHSWMIYCYEKSSWQQIFFLSTIMKFIPITFFCHFINIWLNMMILLILNSIFMSIYINMNFSLKKLFACSTSFNNILMIFMFLLNIKQFIMFCFMYSINLYFIINILKKSNSKLFIMFNSKNLNFIFKLWMLIYSMMPLFMSFMMKWNFLYEIMKFNNNLYYMYLLYLMFSLLLSWKYFIILKKFSFKNLIIYKKLNMNMNIFMFMWMMLFIFMFIMFNFINN
uniref:NADH dehydrogenase subunit 2 n=1 Tax=Melipona scutellaris TaxID=263364 RepID=A0A0B4U3K2_9HYME|nr:NADH dehydrogenase subunit 2 [Melipona scutellaris]AJC00743.1 NADH dehydrogenase subunit 2 [Melipona scutellaris]